MYIWITEISYRRWGFDYTKWIPSFLPPQKTRQHARIILAKEKRNSASDGIRFRIVKYKRVEKE